GKSFEVPLPEGFVRVDGASAVFDQVLAASLPATNKLLAFYGTEQNLTDLEGGKNTEMTRNFNVQSINEQMDCSLTDFAFISKQIEDEMESGMKMTQAEFEKSQNNTNEVLSDLSDDQIAIDLGRPVPLGVLGKGETWITFALKAPMQTQAGDETLTQISTTVNTMILVNNKVIGLYGTHIDGGEGALEQLKKELDAWRTAIEKANAAQ
ncbi:MAG: hypothetical protein AAGF67_06885, partial [Verrucomicrobiota bacterium]